MEERPSKIRKRTTQACENCRRKKGRCPGERPTCSLCARLGQQCTYKSLTGPDEDSPVSPRQSEDPELLSSQDIRTLHQKLDEVLQHVKRPASTAQTVSLESTDHQSTVIPSATFAHGISHQEQRVTRFKSPPRPLMLESANLFIKYCHCQPLPLFSLPNFADTLHRRDPELILCVVGLSTRFRKLDDEFNQEDHDHDMYLQQARDMVFDKLRHGPIELSAIQSLLLIALAAFYDGNQVQAGQKVTAAIDLCRAAKLERLALIEKATDKAEEYTRTMWSTVMLQYLIGGSGVFSTLIDMQGVKYPSSDGFNELVSPDSASKSDFGVTAYALAMTEVWYSVRQWVQDRGKLDKSPPWSEKSTYSAILFRQMELESQMPPTHRFKPSNFAEQYISTLSTNRLYWAPWLYLQMIYHAVVCALNHPILLSLHLRRFKVNQIPELFLQHTADMIASHTDWMIHLITIASEKHFDFTNPALGQCVAIVGTIFLQQSYTEDQMVRIEKQSKFSICLQFVEKLGRHWPTVMELANDLKRLEAQVTRAYNSSAGQPMPDRSQHVDLKSFWRVMDNSIPSAAANTSSIFGNTLKSVDTAANEAEVLTTRPIPEPTRVRSLTSHPNTAASTPADTMTDVNGPVNASMVSAPGFLTDNSPFLAQDYFALGQDFVGNVDDWFSFEYENA